MSFTVCCIPRRDFVVTQEPVLFSYEMDVSGEMELDLQKRALISLMTQQLRCPGVCPLAFPG